MVYLEVDPLREPLRVRRRTWLGVLVDKLLFPLGIVKVIRRAHIRPDPASRPYVSL